MKHIKDKWLNRLLHQKNEPFEQRFKEDFVSVFWLYPIYVLALLVGIIMDGLLSHYAYISLIVIFIPSVITYVWLGRLKNKWKVNQLMNTIIFLVVLLFLFVQK